MSKKSVVALALFAGLLTSSSSFAQSFTITSASTATMSTAGIVQSDPNIIKISVHQDGGALAYNQCWVQVKYFGADKSASVHNDAAIVTRNVQVCFQPNQTVATVDVNMYWTDFAARDGAKRKTVFFNAQVYLPYQPTSKVEFTAIAP